MAQLIVRNVEEDVKIRLHRRAARHGQSMEEEIRSILRDAVKDDEKPARGLGSEIAAMFRDNALDLERMPRQPLKPAVFDE